MVKSSFGTGGMKTKIEAAKLVNKYGTTLVITQGKKKDIVKKVLHGEERAAVILPVSE